MAEVRIVDISKFSDDDYSKAYGLMEQTRKERCQRYKFEDDRRRMVFADLCLRELLCEKFKAQAGEVHIYNLSSGKPVAEVKGKEVFVSISHSGDFAAACISDKPVGIDIEAERAVKRSFVMRAFSEDEISFILSCSEDESLSAEELKRFLSLWTTKEALVKLTGEGLKGLRKAEVKELLVSGLNDGYTLDLRVNDRYALAVVEKK